MEPNNPITQGSRYVRRTTRFAARIISTVCIVLETIPHQMNHEEFLTSILGLPMLVVILLNSINRHANTTLSLDLKAKLSLHTTHQL